MNFSHANLSSKKNIRQNKCSRYKYFIKKLTLQLQNKRYRQIKKASSDL